MLYTLSGGTCFESHSDYCLCEYESLSAMLYTLSGDTCFESRSGYCLCKNEIISVFSESREANRYYNGNRSISSPYQIHKALSVQFRR